MTAGSSRDLIRSCERLLGLIPDAFAVNRLDDGVFIMINNSFTTQFGYAAAEIVGRTPVETGIWLDAADFTVYLGTLAREQRVDNYEARFRRRDGSVITCLITSVIMPMDDGDFIFSNTVDISERIGREEALRASARQLADIIAFLPDATFVIDTRGKVLAWNRALERLTGVSASAMIGKGDYEYAVPLYGEPRPMLIDLVGRPREEVESKYLYTYRDASTLTGEAYFPRLGPQGTYLWGVATQLHDSRGKVIGAIETMRDVTEKRRAEQALKVSEEKFSRVFNTSPDLISISGLEDGILYEVNDSFVTATGYGREELIGMSSLVLGLWSQPAERERFVDVIIQNSGEYSNFDITIKTRDGRLIFGLLSAKVIEFGGRACVLSIFRDMTERRKTETALQESEIRFKLLLDSTAEAIYGVDGKGNCTFANETCCRLLGYDNPGELTGRHMHNLIHYRNVDGSPYPEKNCPIFQAVQSGVPVHGEREVFWRKDGTSFPVEYWSHPVRSGDSVSGSVVAFLDISERKTVEEALSRSEEKYRSLFETMREGFALHEVITGDGGRPVDYRFIDMNPAFEEMTGLKKSSALGRTVLELLPDTGADRIEDLGGVALTGESRHIIDTIGEKYVEMLVYRPRPAQFAIIATDITNRVLSDQAVMEYERRFSNMLENVKLLAVMLDMNGKITYINDHFLQATGWEYHEVIGQDWFKTFGLDRTVRDAFIKSLRDEDLVRHYENSIRTRSGEIRYIHWNNSTLRDSGGAVCGAASIGEDITETRKIERALKDQQNFSMNLLENSAVATFVLNTDHRVMIWNRAAESLTGFSASEMVGTDNQWMPFYDHRRPTVADVILDNKHQDIAALYQTYSRSTLNPDGLRAEGWFRNLGGKERYIVFDASPIRNENGEIIAAIETLQDITGSKKLEEQLLQSQKMDAVGKLAGGVAHDFNNMLTAIIGYANMIKMKLPPDDPVLTHVEQVLSAGEKAAGLTQSLLAFSRKQIINPKPVNINEVINGINKLLRRVIGEDIELRTELSGEDMTILVDRGQIDQVLMNLATNARDAMPDGGTFTIATKQTRLDSDKVRFLGLGKPGQYVLITVSDTGKGMDEKTREQIFEPFFTTKELGKGTGLGLAIVYGVVSQNQGHISCSSKEGKGTVFTIYFPLVERHETAPRDAAGLPLQRGSETVLVAEDDDALRELAKVMLEENGYRVIAAVDGEEAVKLFRQAPRDIALLILDVIMPRMNGREAAEEIALINPGVKVLFISGYTDDIVHSKGRLDESINYIAKPLTPDDFLKKVRDVLDG